MKKKTKKLPLFKPRASKPNSSKRIPGLAPVPLEKFKESEMLRNFSQGKFVRIWSAEHMAWWRPEGKGYTGNEAEAWAVHFDRAYKETEHCGPEKKIHFEFVVLVYQI